MASLKPILTGGRHFLKQQNISGVTTGDFQPIQKYSVSRNTMHLKFIKQENLK